MNIFFKKTLSIILITSIFSTNVLAISGNSGSEEIIKTEGKGTVLESGKNNQDIDNSENNSENTSTKETLSESEKNKEKKIEENQNENLNKNNNSEYGIESKNFSLTDSGKNSEGKLFAILLEKKLSKNSKIFNGVKKYSEEIQKKFPKYSSKIYLIDEDENQNSIFSKLEYLYFNGEKKGDKINFLDGIFLIGDLPIPEIQIDEGFEEKKSFFPYTDFEEKFFIFNDEKKIFKRQKEISKAKSEIFSGILREKNGENDEKFYENYFEKLNNFYGEGKKNFTDNKFFLADLEMENKSANETLLKQYEKTQKYLYEISYQKYSSDLANKLQDEIFGEISEPVCSKYKKCVECKDSNCSYEKTKGIFDETLVCEEGFYAEEKETENCIGLKPDFQGKKITESNTISKMQIEKYIPEYYKVVEGYVQKVNDLIFKSGENKENLKTIPLEIFIKDFLSKEFIKSTNELFEEKIISDLENYVKNINNGLNNLRNNYKQNNYNENYTYNSCNYINNKEDCFWQNYGIPKNIILKINNSPNPKTIKEAIQKMDMNLKIDIRNNIYFKDSWGERNFYLPNLFESKGDIEKYSEKYLEYVNPFIEKISNSKFYLEYKKYEDERNQKYQSCSESESGNCNDLEAKKSFENFISTLEKKSFSKNFFDEIIFETKSDFEYFFDWINLKNANEKRKKILEEKIFQNKENFHKNNLEKIDDFSTFYFRGANFGNGENFYIEDLEKSQNSNSEFGNNKFNLGDFGDGEGNLNSDLDDKCGSINGVELPEWFDAIQCWLDDIKDFGDTKQCGGGSKESWESFWNGEKFENSIGIGNGVLNGENEDFKIFSYPENFSGPINQKEKILLESKNFSGTEKNFFETFTIPETEGIKILNKDIDSEKPGIQIQGLSNFTSLNFEIEKEGNYKLYINGENSIGTEIEINGLEKLYFSAKQKEIGIIKDGAYNSVLLDFFTIDENGKKVDFTGYAKLKFKDGKNGLINNEDLFFENGKATTGIVSKEKNPTLIISGNGIKERNINLHFSKSRLAKDLVKKEKIPDNVKKININGANFYSAFLFGKEYANLENGIAFELLKNGKALSISSTTDNFIFYNEDSDYIKNYENLRNGVEKDGFGIGFGDEEKAVMKFLSGDSIGNSVKSENGIFSVILGDPMISFENKKNPNEFTKTIGKEIYNFSGDVDKIEIIDFNSDGQEDFLAFMKDGFIKLFKGENGDFIKKGDLAFFSSNVEKSFIGNVNNDGKDDFILKLYDGREIFFENEGDGKFKKNILSKSIIEKFLEGKIENFDIKKNILGEDDAKNKEYGKEDVQKILADAWGVDINGEYLINQKESLQDKIGDINEKLNEAVSFISNLTCMGGSCISSPVNYAFLVPGKINIPGFLKQAISYTGGPVPGTPAFGMILIPCHAGLCPMPCSGTMCYGGAVRVYRHYISPTITGGLGYAYCLGETSPYGTVTPNCFITALPVNQLGICEQKDPLGDAVQGAVQSFNEKSQSFKSGGGDGGESLFSQMIGSGGIPENEDAYVFGLDGTDIKIFDENNKTMSPFFSGFLTRWMDKQIKEVSVNMLQLPTIKLILPDIKSGFKSIEDGWNDINLKNNDKIFNFSSNLAEEKKKLEKYQKSLDAKNLENDKKGFFSTVKTESGTFLGEQSFNKGKANINASSKTIEESYDEIFKEIEKLPILQLKREKINLNIPRINPYKLNKLILQINDFIEIHEKILKNLPKDQFIYLRNYIEQLKKNLEVLKTYRDFPQEIMKYRFLLSKYIGDVINIIDCITDYLGGWIIKNKKIIINYIKIYYFIKNIIKIISNLSFVFEDYKQSCSPCMANTYLSNFSLAQIFMSLIPEPPVIKMPKLPDIKIDLSDIQLGIIVNIPEINFRVKEIFIPDLNLPTLAFGNLNLPLLKIPAAPKLPELPEIPAIEIPKLPDLPPAPKLPEFPSWIADLTETIRLVLKLYCLIFEKGLFVYPESTVKQVIEGLTNRSSSNFLPLDFLFLQFPNISFSTIREIQVNTRLNLKFEDGTMYKMLKEKAKKLNQVYKPLQESINNVFGEFNKSSSNLGNSVNKKTETIFDDLNKDLNKDKAKNQNEINNSVTW